MHAYGLIFLILENYYYKVWIVVPLREVLQLEHLGKVCQWCICMRVFTVIILSNWTSIICALLVCTPAYNLLLQGCQRSRKGNLKDVHSQLYGFGKLKADLIIY
jgi:hypothetical protein